jgi:hypothetical protein
MREDFCAFILTHGRPDNVITYRTLRSHGYTGKIFIVIDDEDETGKTYKRNFGDDVLVFSKDEVGQYTDQFDNSLDNRAILWARNACWGLARQMGYKYFIQLDDDYTAWQYRRMGKKHYRMTKDQRKSNRTPMSASLSTSFDIGYHGWKIGNLLLVFAALVKSVETTPIKTIALSQGGDHIGGDNFPTLFRRKAMNSFVCSTDRPILFRGRFNDDVNTYVTLGRTGHLFFTYMELQLDQVKTQQSTGGMTEAYRDSGAYQASFYTVMAAPSCTTLYFMGNTHKRIHHKINYHKTFPRIIAQEFRKIDAAFTKDYSDA